MPAQTEKSDRAVPPKTGSPPYPFRVGWAALLLGINFLVAAFYFHIFG